MNRDLKSLLPWLVLPLFVALVAIAEPRFFGPAMENRRAPDFTLEVVSGEGIGDRVQLSHLRGRVVVLDFWASWCAPCRRSIPILNQVKAALGDAPVSFYGVNVEQELGPRQLMLAHESFGARFPSFQDLSLETKRDYEVRSLPTLVVIDRQGMIRDVGVGVPSSGRLERTIRSLLP